MRRALHTVHGFAASACVGLLLPFAVAGEAAADPVTVTNGVQFTDSAGNVLHGHGGGMIKVGATSSSGCAVHIDRESRQRNPFYARPQPNGAPG
jgi:hypothetical protein